MRPAQSGTIVNVTVSPHHGMPAMAHTGAARAAVEAMTRDLADRWRGDGVSAMAIALGRFATESLRKYPAELWKRAAQTVPLQRLGEVEEYGWLVALLASPVGPSFSGSTLTLDGALDNWTGPWPPPDLVRDGEVPTEERRPLATDCVRRFGRAHAARLPFGRPAGEVSTVALEPSKLSERVRLPSPALRPNGHGG